MHTVAHLARAAYPWYPGAKFWLSSHECRKWNVSGDHLFSSPASLPLGLLVKQSMCPVKQQDGCLVHAGTAGLGKGSFSCWEFVHSISQKIRIAECRMQGLTHRCGCWYGAALEYTRLMDESLGYIPVGHFAIHFSYQEGEQYKPHDLQAWCFVAVKLPWITVCVQHISKVCIRLILVWPSPIGHIQ